jgi:hypothetical protein
MIRDRDLSTKALQKFTAKATSTARARERPRPIQPFAQRFCKGFRLRLLLRAEGTAPYFAYPQKSKNRLALRFEESKGETKTGCNSRAY